MTTPAGSVHLWDFNSSRRRYVLDLATGKSTMEIRDEESAFVGTSGSAVWQRLSIIPGPRELLALYLNGGRLVFRMRNHEWDLGDDRVSLSRHSIVPQFLSTMRVGGPAQSLEFSYWWPRFADDGMNDSDFLAWVVEVASSAERQRVLREHLETDRAGSR